MKFIQEGEFGVNGVTSTLLKDHLSGHVQHVTKPDPPPYLDKHEEKVLSSFIADWDM